MQEEEKNYFETHPIVTTIMCWSIFFFILIVVSEIGLRLFITYSPNYYVGSQSALNTGAKKTLQYPWGEIYINSDGLPDHEFRRVKDSPRIAYAGDSVCFGIGVGYGYRVSENLEKRFPQFEHMNLGYTSDAVPGTKLVSLAKKYQFDKVIYLMNLNDILPTVHSQKDEIPMRGTVNLITANLDWLRSKSYLYNYLRFTLKNVLLSMGYEVHGQIAYERYPTEYRYVVDDTVKQIATLNDALQKQGTKLVIVILPYEMQISEEAAQAYWKHGIRWEKAFIDRSPQKLLEKGLKQYHIETIDGYWAFVNPATLQQDRNKNKLGQYFVYNKGDKLDWVHFNRLGQRVLSDYLAKQIHW